MRIRARENRYATVAGFAAATLLIAACQATTSQTTDNEQDSVYPGTKDSPGLTDTSITIALPGASDSESQFWENYGPMYLTLKSLVDARNADGGVAGRKIDPVWSHDALAGDESTVEDLARRSCALSVTENSSFALQAVTYEELANLEGVGCVGPTRTINVILDTMVNADVLAENPDVVAPNALDDVTAAHVLVERLADQGFFDGAQKVAVLSPGGAFAQTAETVVAADLEAAGIEDPLLLVGAAGTTLTEASAASLVLQMKSENVDRIVYFDDKRNSYPLVTAMLEQQYTPPIGTLSSAPPDHFAFYGYPIEQTFAVSWLAGFALGEDSAATLATLPDTPASKACAALPESAGVKLGLGAQEHLLGGCNTLDLLDAAFEASGADEPSTAAFFSGLEKLTDFDSAYGISLDFSHGRFGITQVWDMKGNAACDCFEIMGPYPVERT